jgi:small multidrug resistance family-3 protein
VRTLLLFVATALAEIIGCYLSCLWVRQGKTPLLLIPAAGPLRLWDGIGSLLALTGMAVIMAAPRGT